jgi:hypothetical protein
MLWFVALAVVAVAPAAGPPTGEPAGIGRVVRGASAATVEAALADTSLEACRGSVKSAAIDNLPCRLAVVAAQARAAKLTTAAELKARQDLITDVLAAATWASSYAPVQSAPGLRRTRLDAHKRACTIVFDGIAGLESVPPASPIAATARTVLTGSPPLGSLREQACACATRTASLAVGADAPSDEQAEVQGVLTTQRCFLAGGAPTTGGRKGPEGFGLGSAATKDLAEETSPAGRLIAMAEGRQLELSRCTDKGVDKGVIKDATKLTTCACGVVKRWSLPFAKSDPRVEANLPLVAGVHLPVVVEAGVISSCGPAAATSATPTTKP